MENKTKIGLIQMTCCDDVDQNYKKTVDLIRQAAGQGAKIICTQELFKSLYFCQNEDRKNVALAEEINEKSEVVKQLCELSAELKIVLIASLFEKRATGIYHNTSIVIDADGSYLGKYRKMHIPDDPHYYEKFYFTPGDLGYKVFKTKYADIGVLICWDQWYPEAARLLGLKGAEIIFIPTAIGHSTAHEDPNYSHAWQTIQQGHAVANAYYVATVNRVGFEKDPSNNSETKGAGPNGESGIEFWGQSFVANPDGKIVKQAPKDQEELLICEVDLALIKETKERFSFPYRDRRIDSYDDILSLYSDNN